MFSSVITRVSILSITLSVASFIAPANNAFADIGATHTGLVSEFASFNSPGVIDGRVEAIAIDGDTVYVGGTFTQIREPLDGEILDQPYLFAYSQSTGNIIRSFDPLLDNKVLSLEVIGDGNGVFAAGVFGRLNDEGGRRGLVKIDLNGDRVVGFGARPNKAVTTLVRLDNTLYVGGNFDTISGTAVENIAAVDVTTGAVSPDLNFDFDGPIPNPGFWSTQGIDDIDITTDGKLLVMAGNFTAIDGLDRTRIAVIELEGQARVSDWNTDLYYTKCPSRRFPQYIRGIDISPDNSYFVVATTGHIIRDNPACDGITRFELNDLDNSNAQPTWANFATDSVYDVVTTGHAVYTGGHFRLLNNSVSMNGGVQGPGAIVRLGLAALDPLNGLTLQKWRSDRNPRGLGTFALIAGEDGLYIGDDTDFLNGTQHQKLKFLPTTDNQIIRPEAHTLPATILTANGDSLNSYSFDGTNLSTATQVSSSGWADSQGGMVVSGQLYRADSAGKLWVSPYPSGDVNASVEADLRGLTSNEWQLSVMGGIFFDSTFSRVYYTKQTDSRLFYRYFTPDGAFFGEKEYIADVQGDIAWGSVSGMDVIDGNLYFGLTDGNLYRSSIDGANVVSGTTQMISGPGIDGINWNNQLIAFSSGSATPPVTGEEYRFSSSGSSTAGRWQVFSFDVNAGEKIDAEISWADPNADVRVFLRDPSKTMITNDIDGGSPATLSTVAETSGSWSIGVSIKSGATDYDIAVSTSSEFEEGADVEFQSNGSAINGSWQVFKFDVVAGEQVDVDVVWDNPMSEVRLFLRDENNSQQDRDIVGLGSGSLSALATSTGKWSVAVRVRTEFTNYTVSINTDAGGDTDGDGVEDLFDAFPNDPTETVDTDGDGIGDKADTTPFGDNVQLSSVNSALGRNVSQSTTRPGTNADRAVDGNTSGVYSQGSVTHTNNNIEAWFQVDLGRRMDIGLIKIFNRTDCCSSRLSNVNVFVSDVDMSERNVTSLVNDPSVDKAFIAGAASALEEIGSIGSGRFVKIQLSGTNYLSLAEVEVYEAILP